MSPKPILVKAIYLLIILTGFGAAVVLWSRDTLSSYLKVYLQVQLCDPLSLTARMPITTRRRSRISTTPKICFNPPDPRLSQEHLVDFTMILRRLPGIALSHGRLANQSYSNNPWKILNNVIRRCRFSSLSLLQIPQN